MVQSLDIDLVEARRRGVGGPHPAAQPRGRGVAARRHDAVAGGDHRRGRGAPRGRATSTSPRTASIFEAAYALHSRGEPVDPVTVAEELRRASQLDQIGGRQTLLRIQAATPASANAAHYAQIVAELAMLRRLIETAGDIQEMAYAAEDAVDETLDRAEAAIFEVAERRVADTLVQLYPALEADDGPARGALRPRERHRRRRHRLPRPRRHPARDCSRRRCRSSRRVPARERRRSRSGIAQHVARRTSASRCCSSRWRWATSSSRSACSRPRRRCPPRKLQTGKLLGARMAAREPGGRPARRSAVLHRRQPALHGDGDARQGAAHQGALRRPRLDRRRLSPADDVARQARREPPGRGVGAVARPEDPRPRARGAGRVRCRSSTASSSTARTSGRCSPTCASRAASTAVDRDHARRRDDARRSASCTRTMRTTSTC